MERISKDGDSLGSINIKEINNVFKFFNLNIMLKDVVSESVSKFYC